MKYTEPNTFCYQGKWLSSKSNFDIVYIPCCWLRITFWRHASNGYQNKLQYANLYQIHYSSFVSVWPWAHEIEKTVKQFKFNIFGHVVEIILLKLLEIFIWKIQVNFIWAVRFLKVYLLQTNSAFKFQRKSNRNYRFVSTKWASITNSKIALAFCGLTSWPWILNLIWSKMHL